MSSQKRLTKAYKNAKTVPFNDQSKFIFFSDCHRGDSSFADDFANNRNMYSHALNYYYNHGFTYCELGDGDELWENNAFIDIFNSHKNVFLLMRDFYLEGRLHRIYGNHDMVYKNKRYVETHLYSYTDPKTEESVPLFQNIDLHEAIILKHEENGQELFLTHGHQADFMNYHGWRFNRFLVRALWKPLQVFGIADPTSPAKNHKELIKVEERTKKWIEKNNNIITIIGHTHRPRFPKPGDTPFFNDGSCVHPRSITGLEIENGMITLIKWHMKTTDEGFLQVVKTILEGPKKLIDYIKN